MLRGEGEFFGAGAYTQFRRLMEVFRSPGAGALRHPVWQCSRAYFTRLELAQEPREDYVAYSFEFCEGSPADGTAQAAQSGVAAGTRRYHVMQSGQTLWHVCGSYGIEMPELLAMNPEIANPNSVTAGRRVRVQ